MAVDPGIRATPIPRRVTFKDRRWVISAALAVLLLVAVAVCVYLPRDGQHIGGHPAATPRERMTELTNADRAEAGLDPLTLSLHVSRHARRHSRQMAEAGFIFHSTVGQLRRYIEGHKWSIIGENIGSGGSLVSLEEAFMASKPHRENILNPKFKHIGVGVIRDDDDVLWLTIIFWG
jgi:uncharacterized protein YkwD